MQSKSRCGELPQVTVGTQQSRAGSCAPALWKAVARQPEEALLWLCPVTARPAAGTFPPGILRIISSYAEFFLQLCRVEEQPCGSAMICERVRDKGVECECLALSF